MVWSSWWCQFSGSRATQEQHYIQGTPTFPPRTSSPIIKQAAVCIVFAALAIADDVIVDGARWCNGDSDEDGEGFVTAGVKVSDGRDR